MKTQIFADNVAIGLSSLCIVHCLVLPLLVAVLPYVAGLALLSNEAGAYLAVGCRVTY